MSSVTIFQPDQFVLSTIYSSHRITSNNEKKIEEFYKITKTLKNNGFPSNKCSFKKYLEYHNIRKAKKLKRFTSIPYVQDVSEPISRILTQVGMSCTLKILKG